MGSIQRKVETLKANIFLFVIMLIGFTGCSQTHPCVEKVKYINRKCPTFDAKLKIHVYELNSTHAAITWEDTHRIETFLKAKRDFNSNIASRN